MTLSRRQFISTAAIVGTSLATRETFAKTLSLRPIGQDVVVIGAGLSGLVCARELVAGGLERVIVLEARHRVGGRTYNHEIGEGRIAEAGGQWVGPTQTAILELCKELEIETFPTYLDGDLIYEDSGARHRLPYSISPPSPLQRKLDALATEVPLAAPWTAANASEWDSLSVADWGRANKLTSSERASLSSVAATTLGASAEQLSFLYFLFYIHSAGSLHSLEGMRGGAQDSRIVGGSQRLSLHMAEDLGEKVVLGAPVRRIIQTSQGVTVETAEATFEAQHAVMALMPGNCTAIDFEPALPDLRQALQQAWPQSDDGLKLNVVYDRPFWRENGLSGLAVSDGPLGLTVDNSPPDGSCGVLMALASASGLGETKEARSEVALAALASLFGPQASEGATYYETHWGEEEHTAGCVSPLAPGILTRYGASLRKSVGRVHFAGTEVAETWTGYMDGAVRAGKAVASRLLRELTVSG